MTSIGQGTRRSKETDEVPSSSGGQEGGSAPRNSSKAGDRAVEHVTETKLGHGLGTNYHDTTGTTNGPNNVAEGREKGVYDVTVRCESIANSEAVIEEFGGYDGGKSDVGVQCEGTVNFLKL